MSNEELVSLIQQGADRTANLETLYFQNLPLIRELCKNYIQFEEMADLEQVAFFGIVEAADHYEPDKGAKFSTYSHYWIKRAIRLHLTKSQLIKKSEHTSSLIYKYKCFVSYYIMQNEGLLPDDRIIMKVLRLTGSQLEDIRRCIIASDYSSLDRPIKTETGESVMIIDFLESPDNTTEAVESIYKEKMQADIGKIMNESLTDEEQWILREYYWKCRTLDEIAYSKGMTRQQIRQKMAKAKQKMNTGKNKRILESYAKLEKLESRRYRGTFKDFKENRGSVIEREVLKRNEIYNAVNQ